MNQPTVYEMIARNKQQEMWATAKRERMVRRSGGRPTVGRLFARLRRGTNRKQSRPVSQVRPLQV